MSKNSAKVRKSGSEEVKKSPLAQARDDWFASDAGVICSNPSSLGMRIGKAQYLQNRLKMAFLAGAKAQEGISA